jgi:LysM repeat protein
MIAVPMVARNGARFLAAIALAATITATYLVVHAALTAKTMTAPTRVVHRPAARHRKFARARFYVVQAGDSLSTIAVKTGVAVATLQTLNPNVDPTALQTGRRLKLRR